MYSRNATQNQISFLQKYKTYEQVSLKVCNSIGQEIKTIIDSKEYTKGKHEITFDATHLSSGIYFYRLTTGKFREVKKMILLK